jgi:hypothetical protein
VEDGRVTGRIGKVPASSVKFLNALARIEHVRTVYSAFVKEDEPAGDKTMSCGCSRQPTNLFDQREGGDAVMEARSLALTYSCGRRSNISRAPLETLPEPVKPNTMGVRAGGKPLAVMKAEMSRTMSLALDTDGTMKEEGTLRNGVE